MPDVIAVGTKVLVKADIDLSYRRIWAALLYGKLMSSFLGHSALLANLLAAMLGLLTGKADAPEFKMEIENMLHKLQETIFGSEISRDLADALARAGMVGTGQRRLLKVDQKQVKQARAIDPVEAFRNQRRKHGEGS